MSGLQISIQHTVTFTVEQVGDQVLEHNLRDLRLLPCMSGCATAVVSAYGSKDFGH